MKAFVSTIDIPPHNHVFICCGTTVEFDRQYR